MGPFNSGDEEVADDDGEYGEEGEEEEEEGGEDDDAAEDEEEGEDSARQEDIPFIYCRRCATPPHPMILSGINWAGGKQEIDRKTCCCDARRCVASFPKGLIRGKAGNWPEDPLV